MNSIIPVTDQTYWIGTNDYTTHLFESIWPLPRGVSYNAYLIDDEKVALVDAVKKGFEETVIDKIERQLGPDRDVDYLVINHMEPDHSGAIQAFTRRWPGLKLVGNEKTARFLEGFYSLDDNFHAVSDGDVLDLGDHKLQFHLTPMVHWPETMMTLDTTTGVLFSGDAFGGFGALPAGIFDDEVDLRYYENETLRYFSNIVGKYAGMVQKAIAKLGDADIRIVAPTHGPVWRSQPERIIKAYDRWSRNVTEPGCVIVFASMYGNTQRMAEVIARSLAEEGIEKVRMHNASTMHVSFLITDAWRFKGLVVGSPTYNTRLFPLMADFLGHLENKKMQGRLLGIFGTYGWSKGAVSAMQGFAERAKWDVVEPIIEAHCSAGPDEMAQCAQLGKAMAQRIRESDTADSPYPAAGSIPPNARP
jgi:flavorubredoxin